MCDGYDEQITEMENEEKNLMDNLSNTMQKNQVLMEDL